jgi:hypothetical protein
VGVPGHGAPIEPGIDGSFKSISPSSPSSWYNSAIELTRLAGSAFFKSLGSKESILAFIIAFACPVGPFCGGDCSSEEKSAISEKHVKRFFAEDFFGNKSFGRFSLLLDPFLEEESFLNIAGILATLRPLLRFEAFFDPLLLLMFPSLDSKEPKRVGLFGLSSFGGGAARSGTQDAEEETWGFRREEDFLRGLGSVDALASSSVPPIPDRPLSLRLEDVPGVFSSTGDGGALTASPVPPILDRRLGLRLKEVSGLGGGGGGALTAS